MKGANVDVLHDPIRKLLIKICVPIILVSLIRIFTTTWLNEVFRAYCPEVFTVLGLLNICVSVLQFTTEGITISAWTETSVSYVKTTEKNNHNIINSVYAGLLLQSVVVFILAVAAEGIFQFLSIPQSILPQARTYYFVFLFSSLLYVVGQTFVRLTTGLGTATQIFVVNMLDAISPLLISLLFLGGLKLGIGGAAAREGVSCLCIALVAIVMLFKNKTIQKWKCKDFAVDFKLIARMLKRAVFLIAQSSLCWVGNFLVSYQTNKCLELDYISVLAVTLPITSVFSAFSTLCSAVIPQNYALGEAKRLKAIFRVIVACCFIYGIIVFLAHALLGTWYYSRLFDDPKVVRLGAEYWFWLGLSLLGCSFLYSFRFFFVSISENTTAMLTGFFELFGNLIAVFWLIPAYGNIGSSIARGLGWWFAALYLVVAYCLKRRGIYASCGKMNK